MTVLCLGPGSWALAFKGDRVTGSNWLQQPHT